MIELVLAMADKKRKGRSRSKRLGKCRCSAMVVKLEACHRKVTEFNIYKLDYRGVQTPYCQLGENKENGESSLSHQNPNYPFYQGQREKVSWDKRGKWS